MRKGKDTAAQDNGAGDHAYLAFQGFLATACHGKAGFFPCFPAAFQSMGRVPGRLFRKQRVAPCPVARSAGEDEGPGGFGKLNHAHSRQGCSHDAVTGTASLSPGARASVSRACRKLHLPGRDM